MPEITLGGFRRLLLARSRPCISSHETGRCAPPLRADAVEYTPGQLESMTADQRIWLAEHPCFCHLCKNPRTNLMLNFSSLSRLWLLHSCVVATEKWSACHWRRSKTWSPPKNLNNMRSNGPGTIVSTSTGPVLVPGKKLSADSSLIAANLILLLQKPISMPRTTAGPLSQKTGTNSWYVFDS
ncbi:hypothetical protein, variant 1 [Puccinia triticina 1-1 BBBD Race 1]|uniref:Uncharacterized protein n=1 Tax=Puccinia triticina (isolate 1-1 / race 1 (BBBD)) TaxID=630390 RepID=A0A180G4K0_PUCT1|nr:hypothetical protein PTTG_12534 [Puccinia triticina 1-1 BBBD Race 1]OAV87510.1 hypothetical protein, variant 1 [Puccinia triticina 1-1 BBBD Race 1]